MDILFFVSLALFAGLVGGKFFRKLRFPQLVGYIVIGVIIGVSGFNLISEEIFKSLEIIEYFTLGIIGFMVGRELKFSVFARLGKTIFTILCFEVLGAFLLVTLTVWLITRNIVIALILGSLATATAPAATVEVLWEYKAKGVLTTTIFSLVALDDVLALFIYVFAVSYAKTMIGNSEFSLVKIIFMPLIEIGSSVLLGVISGFVLGWLAEKVFREKQCLPLILAMIMLNMSIAKYFHLSHILSCMILGMTLVNLNISRGKYAFMVIEDFTGPLYILFFVLVGSQLQVRELPNIGMLGLAYIGARMAGKITGAKVGGKVSHAAPAVRKYLGYALFDQAGVAIGLALAVKREFSYSGVQGEQIGELVLNIIMASTFVVQLIGPSFVKYAIVKAGEAGVDPKVAA